MAEDAVVRPAEFCHELLAALAASDGRRRRRKRDTTPDALGMAMKRALLEAAVADDPEPAAFEEWLYRRTLTGPGSGGIQAMALAILEEWRYAADLTGFRDWLAQGAPSDDTLPAEEGGRACAR